MIEDNSSDELITRRAFSQCSVPVNVLGLHNNSVALEFLRNRTTNIHFPRPDIIFLDLNISKQEETALLREIKRDRELSDIPVIIFTNSIEYCNMMNSYKQYASGFILKSCDYQLLAKNIESLVQYWAQTVVLPGRSQGKVTK